MFSTGIIKTFTYYSVMYLIIIIIIFFYQIELTVIKYNNYIAIFL